MSHELVNDRFRKNSAIILVNPASDAQFEQIDYALINYLMLRSYNEPPRSIYRIPVRDVMDYLRIDRIGKLHASLDRLCKIAVTIDYVDPTDGTPRCLRDHYLSSDISRSVNGTLIYAFGPIISNYLYEPSVYGMISVNRIRDLKSPVSQKLYELLSLQYRKKSPVWDVWVDELREFFQMRDKYPRFDNFRANVIEKAVKEVNTIAEFETTVEYVRGGRGGAVQSVIFKVLPKSHMKLIEAAAVKSTSGKIKKTDPKTVDLLDGLTYEERGGPAQVTVLAIEKAREMMPEDGDLNVYLDEWRESVRGLVLRDADAHFLAWLTIKLQQDEDPLLKDIDDDVFGNLLGDKG